MATPTGLNTSTYEIDPDDWKEIPATGKDRYVHAVWNMNYIWSNGGTELPTSGWTRHVTTLNDEMNFPNSFGSIWIYNPDKNQSLHINVHLEA